MQLSWSPLKEVTMVIVIVPSCKNGHHKKQNQIWSPAGNSDIDTSLQENDGVKKLICHRISYNIILILGQSSSSQPAALNLLLRSCTVGGNSDILKDLQATPAMALYVGHRRMVGPCHTLSLGRSIEQSAVLVNSSDPAWNKTAAYYYIMCSKSQKPT